MVEVEVERMVSFSMMLICDASVVIGYDRRRSRLCNALINMKYDNYSCHRDIAIAISLNISKHTTLSLLL